MSSSSKKPQPKSTERDWEIPPEFEKFVASKCPDGLSLVCNVCSRYDEERSIGFGKIHSRTQYPFGWGPFAEHIRSSRHGENEVRRDTLKRENEKRKEEGKSPKKRQKMQSILCFATKKPTKQQVHARVANGNVSLNLACGDNSNLAEEMEEDQARLYEIVNELENEIIPNDVQNGAMKNCCGVLAKKDLNEAEIQNALKLVKRYCARDYGILETCKIENINRMDNVLSMFATSCKGESTCVKLRGTRKQSSLYGLRCSNCHDFLVKSLPTFMKNKRAKLIKKGRMLKAAEEIRDGVIVYNESDIHNSYVTALVKTTDLSILSPDGILLRTSVMSVRKFFQDMEKKNKPRKNECQHIRKVVVVGGTHGNEYTGVWCIKALARRADELAKSCPSLDIETLLSNPEAYKANKRFIDTDLNREFSEKKLVQEKNMSPTVESMRAQELNELLGPKFGVDHPKTDVIVDLHTTTTNMGVSLIVPEGDVEMVRAAAYVSHKCGGEEGETRILVHSIPRNQRPGLASVARHGFTLEVGPVPQGVLRHDVVEKTEKALHYFLEYLELQNSDKADVENKLNNWYPTGQAPVYQSAKARAPGEMSGKIIWPSDPDNPNFPQVIVHKSIQDRDFHKIKKGDPLFVDLDGKVIPYSGSHGDEVYLIFVNEGGYYYSSSGTGIGVSVKREVRIRDGIIVE